MLCRYEASIVFAAILVVMATSAEATRMYEPQDYRSIVPTDWRLLPPDPGSHERRFVSPLGDAWLSLYAEPAIVSLFPPISSA
jgi:hypothetical protein